MPNFSSEIYKIGINPVVDPPAEVLAAIFADAARSKGPIPVRGTLAGAEFIQTLVRYQGAWRLYINGPMLRTSGLAVGDTADVNIEFDPRPREVPMPKLFRKALNDRKAASDAFYALSPSRQKEILRYLGNLKTEESLQRNVKRVTNQLAGDIDGKPHVALRMK